MKKRFLIILLASTGLLNACTWVKLSSNGERVTIVKESFVSGCKKIGTTTATVADSVIGLKRSEKAVQGNLDNLARNAAADMGGDTLVRSSEIKDGKQIFTVYLCNLR